LAVDTRSRIPALPGSYFYINVPRQHSSVCVPITWWTDEENGFVSHIEVLINRNVPGGFKASLGGPYGGDLRMGSFETIVLAGQGMGIAGILPFVLSLVSRKKHDKENKRRGVAALHCDMTRSIDLIWNLDRNCQYECVAGYFESLAN
ncbi:hypothetical protein F5144DRAFT_465336, partial [Chaetomium tenue]